MAGTPLHTSVEKLYKSEKDGISADPEVARAIFQYYEQHPECQHWDERCYLHDEILFFRSRDVLIHNSRGEIIAGIRHNMKVPISNIYRWIGMVFTPSNGWNILQLPDRKVLDRESVTKIAKGHYLVTGCGELILLIMKFSAVT
jgi:hypothetical protein